MRSMSMPSMRSSIEERRLDEYMNIVSQSCRPPPPADAGGTSHVACRATVSSTSPGLARSVCVAPWAATCTEPPPGASVESTRLAASSQPVSGHELFCGPSADCAVHKKCRAQVQREWLDKSHLLQLACARVPHCRLLFHKIALISEPGNRKFSKPAFSHVLAFGFCDLLLHDKVLTPDVSPRGDIVWSRGTGSTCCVHAVEFCRLLGATTIVDPFCGHGTVLAAANAAGLELRPPRSQLIRDAKRGRFGAHMHAWPAPATTEDRDGGYGAARRPCTPPESAAGTAQQLFRNRFIVNSDFVISLPVEAPTLMRAFVTHSELAGCFTMSVDSFRPLRKVRWSPDAQRMLSLPNAGGSSVLSEALSFELIARTFGASLEKCETELSYHLTPDGVGSKMTDYAIDMYGGYPIGVSVTRAYKYRDGAEPSGLDALDARDLLRKKLVAINASSRHVRNHRFRKQLLHVWALSHRDAMLLESEYARMPGSLRANTVLLIARCNGVRWIW